MKVFRSIPYEKLAPAAVTIGTFDGVHLGHQKLIKQMVSEARISGLQSIVLTFDNQPRNIVDSRITKNTITPLQIKIDKLKKLEIDTLIVLNFDQRFAAYSPEDFINQILVEKLNTRLVVVGPDFHFGKDRTGDADLLRQVGKTSNFDVTEVSFLRFGDDRVSSTRIRQHLFKGEFKTASLMLGEAEV